MMRGVAVPDLVIFAPVKVTRPDGRIIDLHGIRTIQSDAIDVVEDGVGLGLVGDSAQDRQQVACHVETVAEIEGADPRQEIAPGAQGELGELTGPGMGPVIDRGAERRHPEGLADGLEHHLMTLLQARCRRVAERGEALGAQPQGMGIEHVGEQYLAVMRQQIGPVGALARLHQPAALHVPRFAPVESEQDALEVLPVPLHIARGIEQDRTPDRKPGIGIRRTEFRAPISDMDEEWQLSETILPGGQARQ